MTAGASMSSAAHEAVTPELVVEIEQFLYREARILDEERWEDWLELLTEDIHYWMPRIRARFRRDRRPDHRAGDSAYFDEDLRSLKIRIARFRSGTAWAEDPPTRHTHLISNVEVRPGDRAGEYRVHSAFVNFRGRNEVDTDTLIGRREDVLRRVDGALRIARRKVLLPQAVLLSKNLNVFL